MREHSRDRGRLEDILKYAKNVEQIVSGITYEQFVADIRIYYSVMKNVEVIGEAANMLTFEFREAHSDLKWRQITNMRNFLIHGYHNVEEDLVWEAISVDLHPIREKIVKYLEETNNV